MKKRKYKIQVKIHIWKIQVWNTKKWNHKYRWIKTQLTALHIFWLRKPHFKTCMKIQQKIQQKKANGSRNGKQIQIKMQIQMLQQVPCRYKGKYNCKEQVQIQLEICAIVRSDSASVPIDKGKSSSKICPELTSRFTTVPASLCWWDKKDSSRIDDNILRQLPEIIWVILVTRA